MKKIATVAVISDPFVTFCKNHLLFLEKVKLPETRCGVILTSVPSVSGLGVLRDPHLCFPGFPSKKTKPRSPSG